MDWQDRYAPQRQPDLTLRQMTAEDLPAALALSQANGWGHDLRDWERLHFWAPDGCFVVEEADRGIIGAATTTSYSITMAWIGMVLVVPDLQRQGIGQRLMRAAIDYLIARNTQRILLDSADRARPLYNRLGFRELHKVERWEGKASTYIGARARRMRPDDIPAVTELDATMFGVRRGHILLRLLDEFPELAWVDYERGNLAGFLLGRRISTGIWLGPWMAWHSTSAERLLRTALEQVQGQQVTLNIPDNNGRALILAENHNLRRIRACTRMIYGDATPIEGESLTELGVADLATG